MGTWLFEPGHTAAMFRARHMMVTYVRGHFKNVSGSLVFDPENPAQSSADVAIDAAAIWTGQLSVTRTSGALIFWMSRIIRGRLHPERRADDPRGISRG
jgi:polyisoprenoid-binding protein YceI